MRDQNEIKTRIIVLTDISSVHGKINEPDDTQSLVRFLLYSNEFEIEGLIASYNEHTDGTKPEYIKAAIKEYGKVRGNLLLHDEAYPDPQFLMDIIKSGNARCGMDQVGPGKDTEGSDWIISIIDKPDPRPVWISIWGGPLDLAQALWKVSQDRSREDLKKFKSKIHVYAIGDQYDETGAWIRENHPDIFYITAVRGERGIYKGGDPALVSAEWVERNITYGHGALGAFYPKYDGGDPWGAVKGLKEGDTPAFLYLIQNGLNVPMQPSWGGWGGRFINSGFQYEEGSYWCLSEPDSYGRDPEITQYLIQNGITGRIPPAWGTGGIAGSRKQYFDATDSFNGETSEWATVYRWRPAFQASFQARLDWCVKPYKEANHEPVAVFMGDTEQTVKAGTEVMLNAESSWDPDGDKLGFSWFHYFEPGSYKGNVEIRSSRSSCSSFVAPNVDSPKTIHIILTVTDEGTPSLSSYRRIVFNVIP